MPINYIITTVTGDCLNIGTGALYIEPIDGQSPYIIDWQIPNLGIDVSVTSSTRNGLSVGTYQILVTDSSVSPQEQPVLLTVSSGICLETSVINSTCGLPNGVLTATATTSVNNVNYYLYSNINGYVTSGTSSFGFYSFTQLPPDTYYVEAIDYGGCSGRSSTNVILDSGQLDYGFFIVNNSRCSGPTGKIYITGQTGVSPYTYLWGNNETTSSISGLTAGVYTVTVIDSGGCSITKQATVLDVEPPVITNLLPVSPSCFQADGQITVRVNGGTAPFYYVLSNGISKIDFSTSVTFTGLSSGIYTVTVTDAGLCTTSEIITLSSPNAFTFIAASAVPSTCGSNNGIINAAVQGGNTPYTYTLTDTSGNTRVLVLSSNAQFTQLPTGTYHLKITNPSTCSYETDISLVNEDKFTINTTSVNTTCGLSNGSIYVTTSTGGTYTYEIPGQLITINSTAHTFNNLTGGVYNVSVTDSSGCRQTTQVLIGSSNKVQFTLIDTGCGVGNEGSITAIITNGQPPFTLNWSSNVGSQNGIYVTGLTAGTYTLNVVDDNDCSLTQSTQIVCGSVNNTYLTYNICDSIFTKTTGTKTGFQQMLNQGFQDLTAGEISCKLVLAQFNLLLNVGSSAFTNNFFTTTTLSQYPTDQQYVDVLNSLLSGITGIGSIVLNPTTNTVSINTDCARTLSADTITIGIRIDYNICCFQESTPTPTPSITPTLTPTPSITPTLTSTPTLTPTSTLTPTPTLTPTSTLTPTPTLTPTSSPAPLIPFTMYANDLTGVYLRQIVSTSTYYINWGDGNIDTYSAGSNLDTQHFYSGGYSPYTGEIKILAYDLGDITKISTDNRIGTGGTNPSLLFVGSELNKLSGLTYFGNVKSIFTGYTSELPSTLKVFYSLGGKLSGDINDLPSSLTGITLGGFETNNISGNTANFPSGMKLVDIVGGTNTIEGNIADIPSGLTYFAVYGFNTISGNTVDIPSGITTFYLYGFNTLVGDISNIPISGTGFIAYGYNSLSGNVLSLSAHTLLRTLGVANRESSPTGNTIDGDIKDIPKKLNYFELRGNNTIYGDIINMPTGSTSIGTSQYFNLTGLNTVSGQASDISVHVSDFFFGGNNTLSGDTSDFSNNIDVMWVGGLNEITGDIANLPPNAYNIRITGLNTIKDYTSGRSWTPNMNDLTIIPASPATNFLSTSEVDNLMNDLTGTTWSNSSRFGQSQITLVGTASTASQSARNKLSGATPGGYGVVITLT